MFSVYRRLLVCYSSPLEPTLGTFNVGRPSHADTVLSYKGMRIIRMPVLISILVILVFPFTAGDTASTGPGSISFIVLIFH